LNYFNVFFVIFFIVNIFVPKVFASTVKDNAPVVRLRHREDTRKTLNKLSPKILNAVGKLSYKKFKKNQRIKNLKLNCTANLISPISGEGSDIVLTAKHCLYDSVRTYSWRSQNDKNELIERTAKVIYEDKDMDWAILKLKSKINHKEIKPLIINKKAFNNKKFKNKEKEDYMVAGFSVDWLGNYGKKLTYEDKPNFIKINESKAHISSIGAVTYQGDSGGAIIFKGEENEGYLVGIMSYISGDKNLFKNEKGMFGNLKGNFLDFVNYDSFFSVIKSVFYSRL
jgi:hypothetical protein